MVSLFYLSRSRGLPAAHRCQTPTMEENVSGTLLAPFSAPSPSVTQHVPPVQPRAASKSGATHVTRSSRSTGAPSVLIGLVAMS